MTTKKRTKSAQIKPRARRGTLKAAAESKEHPTSLQGAAAMLVGNLKDRKVQGAIAIVLFDVVLPLLALVSLAEDELQKREPTQPKARPDFDWMNLPPTPAPPAKVAGDPPLPRRLRPQGQQQESLVVDHPACNCQRCSARRAQQGVN